ncbi:hypothetical protein FOA52_015225 [Chlamydomonas sp. UWO 241]|nr:hypothetical protein FOA52_015225 [Chlamydomonas sp. UWO 241]
MSEAGPTVEELFKGQGTKPGVAIWDVRSFALEPLPDKLHGTFYTGDSYLVLRTYKQDDETEKLLHDIHFWIGAESSQDEAGCVALFAMQLDDFLGGSPVQHRQVQQQEDAEFRMLFPKMTYKRGGRHASGFKHAEADAKGPTRMYQIRSPSVNAIQVFEVPLSVDSLCQSDSYVLEVPTNDVVYLWQGSATNIREKIKSRDVATSMRMDSGTMKMSVVDSDDISSTDAVAFFELLGCSSPADASIKDADQDKGTPREKGVAVAPKMFRCSEGAAPVALGEPSRAALADEGQFAVMTSRCVWVWTGSLAGKPALARAFASGSAVLAAEGQPAAFPVRCVKAGWEPNAFAEAFPDW